jgi:D-glycero-D-manno-heptose 1,7-bisphosphate phosphatase
MSRAAIFLDRDGVIVDDPGYVHRVEDLVLLPGVIDGLLQLRSAGYALVIVTNQSGIARGFFTEAHYRTFTDALLTRLHESGVDIDAVHHCSHLPDAAVAAYAIDCDCRKPRPGLLLRAIEELGLDPARSFMVGDKPSDIEAGRAAGLRASFLIADAGTAHTGSKADAVFPHLKACVAYIVGAPGTAPTS